MVEITSGRVTTRRRRISSTSDGLTEAPENTTVTGNFGASVTKDDGGGFNVAITSNANI